MTTIDHAAKAMELRTLAAKPNTSNSSAANLIAAAQVHATLALVEQQRLANIIALHRHEVEYDIGGDRSYLYKPATEDLRDDIRKGLGL